MSDPSDRLPPLVQFSPEQAAVVAEIRQGPRGMFGGPFIPLLRSPELCRRTQAMGEFLRYSTVLPPLLSEMAILMVAVHWHQPVEWAIHRPIAERAGLPATVIEAIAKEQTPRHMTPHEAALHNLCRQGLAGGIVDDTTYALALDSFGERGVVEVLGLLGYYAMLALVMNVARTPVPATT